MQRNRVSGNMQLHRALSERQESRLVLYLDDALLKIQRKYQKRNEPSASFSTLFTFLEAWDTPLDLVTSIPIIGSSAALRDAYLLRVTSELTEGIIGYNVAMDTRRRDVQLTFVLYWLDLLDRVWSARMNREQLDLNAARHDSKAAYPWDKDEKTLQNARDATSSFQPPTSRISTPLPADVVTFQQTDRIRLREVLVTARGHIFSWMRSQIGEKAPPMLDEMPVQRDPVDGVVRQAAALAEQYTKIAGNKRQHDSDDSGAQDEPQNKRTEIEEAVSESEEPAPPAHDSAHYDQLFSRKLDPDASDDNDDEEGSLDPKQPGMDALAYWDLQYSTSFSRVLRLLHKTTPVSAPDQ